MGTQAGRYEPLLRVGVTGHKLARLKPEEWTRLAPVVNSALGDIVTSLARYKKAPAEEKPVKLRVVSLIADGADQLVCVEAMKLESADVAFHCILPFAADEYRNDFTDREASKRFDELRRSAEAVFEYDGRRDDAGEGETYAYLAAGEAMLRNCDLLVAVWDGKTNGKLGGTADIVEKAVRRGLPVLWLPIRSDEAPHFITLAGFRPSPAVAPTDVLDTIAAKCCQEPAPLWLDPADEAAVSEPDLPGEYAYDAVLSWAEGEAYQRHPIPAARSTEELTSQLADRFGRRYRSSFLWLYTFAVGAVTAAAVSGSLPDFLVARGYEHTHTVAVGLSLFEIGMIGLSVGVFLLARRQRWQMKWLHYRQVAEGLRQSRLLFPLGQPPEWASASGDDPPTGIRFLKDSLRRQAPVAAVASRKYLENYAVLLRGELAGQQEYHTSRATTYHEAHIEFEVLSHCAFVLAAVATLAHLAFHEYRSLTVAAIVFPAIAASLHGFSGQANLALHSTESKAMAQKLTAMIDELDAKTAANAGAAELTRLAQDAVACLGSELSGWQTQTSARPIALP